ncbi:MAG: YigZ family protein [Chitinophagaceae bacterium]|nr:YigZ family protein [Chitinophagaceae bacterium]MCB9046647.1 YigZ family protein [Chitinophagales bacterium]
MDEQYTYRTITAPTTSDFRDRGSKFFGFAYPVRDVEEVKEHVKALKKEHPKAVHYCLGFRIGTDGTLFRANDDGEPSGSAGKPILGQIDSAGLTNVLVVVVRYFGGSLLGVPGLINAYKTATEEALAKAEVVEKQIEQMVTISFDYPAMNDVMQQLKQSEATIYRQDLQLFCEVEAGIPVRHSEQYITKLEEIRGVTLKQQ